MKIKCIIVDDEQYARKLLEEYISKIPDLELAGQCKNSMEARQLLNSQQVDLMFLDIQMPDLTGIDFLKTLTHKPVVIFTTAYQEYAYESYQLDVIDYMVKPFTFDRFLRGVNKALEYLKIQRHDQFSNSSQSSSQNNSPDFINIKADYKIYKLAHEKILFIEGLKEYVTFYTSERKYIVLESLKRLEGILPEDDFIRVHKSYIINTKRADSLYGNMIEIGEHQIPIGKSYNEGVKGRLFKL